MRDVIRFSAALMLSTPALCAPSPTVWTHAEGVLSSCVEAAPICPSAVSRTRFLGEPRECLPDGSRACPWVDRDLAISSLQPGDTLVFLPGRYDLSGGWKIENLHGNTCQAITLRAEPGAIFSAELDAQWRLAESGPGGEPIPEGVRLFEASLDAPATVGIGLFWETGEGAVALPRYKRATDLLTMNERYQAVMTRTATCGSDGSWTLGTSQPHDGSLGLYVGPGYFVEPAGDRHRILVRLQPTVTSRLQGFEEPVLERLGTELHPYRLDSILEIQRSSHLVLENWNLRFARQLLISGGAHHIDIDGLRAVGLPGSSSLVRVHAAFTGLQIEGCASEPCHVSQPQLCPSESTCFCSSWRNTCFAYDGPPHHLRFRRADLSAGFPPWLFWTDMKGRSAFAEEGRCNGWSFLAENDASECDCSALTEIPAASPRRLAHTHENPGNLEMHGAIFGVTRNDHERPADPYCLSLDDSRLQDGWFGVYAVVGERLRMSGNELLSMHDDAVLLSNLLHDVEVAHNEIRDNLSSFSSTGVAGHLDSGDYYIHHNVVDTTGDGSPARRRIACARPGAEALVPEWNHHDVDGDGTADGFCSGLVQGGHGVWGIRWNVYANTLLVDNAMPGGALSSVKQSRGHPEPAYFVGNILVQAEPGRPLYGAHFYERFGDADGCAADIRGAQIIDGNLYWRPGDPAEPFCDDEACCEALPAPSEQGPLITGITGAGRTAAYSSLAHFQCGITSTGLELSQAALSACAYDLECEGCPSTSPGVNEGRSIYRAPGVGPATGYRPAAEVERRVALPGEWPESDWPWIGARAPQAREDCVFFDPENLRIAGHGERFRLVDGSHALRVFEHRDEARRVESILRAYGTNQHCFVGRPDPSLTYVLAGHRSPSGPLPGEDCSSFDPDRLEVITRGGRSVLRQASRSVFAFDDQAEAHRALELIRLHRFTHSCFVGRPGPSFRYLRR